MENDAWNLSKHETYIFKFYDQVNKDYIIYDFSYFFNLSGKFNTLIVFSAKMKLGSIILFLTFLSILVLS